MTRIVELTNIPDVTMVRFRVRVVYDDSLADTVSLASSGVYLGL